MRRDKVTTGGEVGGAHSFEPKLGFGIEGQGENQRRLVGRWLELTQVVLPALAAAWRGFNAGCG